MFLGLRENTCTYLCETETHGQKSETLFTCPVTWQYGTAPEGHSCPLEQLEAETCWGISDYSIYLSLGKWSPSISAGSYPEIKFKAKIPKCNIYMSISPIIICGCSGIGLGSYKLVSHISLEVCWSILPFLYLLHQKKTGLQKSSGAPNPTDTPIWTRSFLSCFYYPAF